VLTSSFSIFNTPNLDEAAPEEKLKSSAVLPNLVFQISSALFSAVESLAQEINVVIGSPWTEDKVGYWSLGKIPETHAELRRLCKEFISQPDFIFLCDLRNLSLHRRITTLAIEARYTLPGRGPIGPSAVNADCVHYFPDALDVAPGREIFEKKLEVKSTLQLLADGVDEFTFSLYGLLAEHLSR